MADKTKDAIKESNDAILRRVRKEALEGLRRLQPKKPLPQAPSELWPGESHELGGWALARAKRKRPARKERYA